MCFQNEKRIHRESHFFISSVSENVSQNASLMPQDMHITTFNNNNMTTTQLLHTKFIIALFSFRA